MSRNVSLQPNAGDMNQRWNIISKNGYYILKNKETGMVLDLTNSDTTNDANIQTNNENGSNTQLFALNLVNSDLAYYHTISSYLNTDKLLTAAGNGVTDTNINIHDNVHNMTQKFYLRKETDGYYIIIHSFSGKALTS